MSPETDLTPKPAEVPAPVVADDRPPSPGAMIRAARERAHLSIDELSAQTKLTRHALESLERDDYKSLLEPVYVRGYYRKCAKVLDLPEHALLEAYQARVEPRMPLAPSKLRLASGTELGSTSRLPIALAIFFAIVAVVICGFLWSFWRASTQGVPPPLTDRAAAQPAPAPAEAGLPRADSPLLPSVTDSPAIPADEAPAAAPPAPPPATPAAGTPTGTLTLAVTLTSWVRIDDASGKSLHNGLINPGERRTFTGAPPLSVFLGNASGVTVEYEGRAVDVAKTMRENKTARFTVP